MIANSPPPSKRKPKEPSRPFAQFIPLGRVDFVEKGESGAAVLIGQSHGERVAIEIPHDDIEWVISLLRFGLADRSKG